MLPESIAWRVLFGIGLLPAVLVLWVRRHIDEPEIFKERGRPSLNRHLASVRGVPRPALLHDPSRCR